MVCKKLQITFRNVVCWRVKLFVQKIICSTEYYEFEKEVSFWSAIEINCNFLEIVYVSVSASIILNRVVA